MSPEGLALISGSVLSLLFSYFPGLNAKFAGLSSEVKRLIMLALLAVVAGAVYGLNCGGFGADIGVIIACDRTGAISLVQAFILALIANQSIYAVSPESKSVAEAKAFR